MGTLQKFVGKIKNVFARNKTVMPVTKQEHTHIPDTEVEESVSESVSKRSYKKRGHFNKPAWWVRFYGKKKRSEVGTLNLHMVKHQGTFNPIREFSYSPGSATPKGSGRIVR